LRVERLLSGRKTLRDFRPAHGRAGRFKSSLDPGLESVLLPERVSGDTHPARAVRRALRLSPNEQLDGVSLIKRLDAQQRFVSTSRVAIDPFIRRAHDAGEDLATLKDLASRLHDADLAERFEANDKNGLTHYAPFPFDCQLFYRARVDRVDGRDLTREEMDTAQSFGDAARKLRQRLGMSDFLPYFAVLRADGDHMGAAIGELTRTQKGAAIGELTRIQQHQLFSNELLGFARRADDTVRQHSGALIYSGGDDVLAFLPLDTAIPCAERLRLIFADVMRGALPDVAEAALPTLSVGIAIGHYAEHLQNLLRWSVAAERAAKKPRNALAIALHTRTSGETALTVPPRPWSATPPPAQRWRDWIDLHDGDHLPDSAAYELRTLFLELDGVRLTRASDLADLVRRETRRILMRKRADAGRRDVDKAVRETVERLIGDDLKRLGEVVSELIIARRLADAVRAGAGTALARWDEVTTRRVPVSPANGEGHLRSRA
ncbi:MAG: type III-B CRISPR-associated protein Cas10/Cmr2, partial [Chloroflexia bacterium]|nr:type III-B CRISPR-associated protein Cas10/Cmr2 [Chloroflexia bacterium]